MQRLNNQSVTGTRSVSRFHQIALAALWIIIALLIAAAPSRSENVSPNGQTAAPQAAAPN